MARLADLRSRETLRLAAELGIPLYAAVGLRELLVHTAFQKADPTVGDALDVELAAGWDGARGSFIAAALASGMIVEGEAGVFMIPDFWSVAAAWVKKRKKSADARKAVGKTISDLRAEAGSKGAAARESKRQSSGDCLNPARQQTAPLPTLPPSGLPTVAPSEPVAPEALLLEETHPPAKEGTGKEGTGKGPQKRARKFAPPSEDEWVSYATQNAKKWPEWSEHDIRASWAYYEARDWKDIAKWQPCVANCYHHRKDTAPSGAGPARPSLFAEPSFPHDDASRFAGIVPEVIS